MGMFDQKTLLEQRWEEEAAKEHMETDATIPYLADVDEEKPEVDIELNLDSDQLDPAYDHGHTIEVDDNFISSPVCGDDIPLVLITSAGRTYIGGLIDVLSGGVVLDHPLVYMEIPDQRNPGALQLAIQKVFHGLPVPLNMWFQHDSLNMLRSEHEQCKRLTDLYVSTLERLSAADAGVHAPSVTDLQNYSRKES